jgi:hypothetical protein
MLLSFFHGSNAGTPLHGLRVELIKINGPQTGLQPETEL